MDKFTDMLENKSGRIREKSYFKAINPEDTASSCEHCVYGQQDIDTYPCAKCHTRH